MLARRAAVLAVLLAAAAGVAWLARPWLRERRVLANQIAAKDGLNLMTRALFDGHRSSGTWWTKDVAGLGVPGLMEGTPYHGYLFRALARDADTEGMFSICAYPEVYGETGTLTYYINGLGVFFMDTQGRCPDRLPPGGGWGIID